MEHPRHTIRHLIGTSIWHHDNLMTHISLALERELAVSKAKQQYTRRPHVHLLCIVAFVAFRCPEGFRTQWIRQSLANVQLRRRPKVPEKYLTRWVRNVPESM